MIEPELSLSRPVLPSRPLNGGGHIWITLLAFGGLDLLTRHGPVSALFKQFGDCSGWNAEVIRERRAFERVPMVPLGASGGAYIDGKLFDECDNSEDF